jgi:hypothetical protein
MRESRTFGSVGGEGGNVLAYPASCGPKCGFREWLIGAPMPRSGRWRASLRFDRKPVSEAVALGLPSSSAARSSEIGDAPKVMAPN